MDILTNNEAELALRKHAIREIWQGFLGSENPGEQGVNHTFVGYGIAQYAGQKACFENISIAFAKLKEEKGLTGKAALAYFESTGGQALLADLVPAGLWGKMAEDYANV